MRTLVILLYVISIPISWMDLVLGSLPDQMVEVTQVCCSQGVAYARNHTSQDCSSSVPPEVPHEFGSLCIYAMDGCCKEFFEKSQDCEEGVLLVAENRCFAAKSDPAKACCNECSRGKSDGASRDTSVCTKKPKADSAEEYLASDAYIKCCMEAAQEKADEGVVEFPSSHHTRKKSVEDDLSSVCEQYAPNELCAHHCIPVPGSYRCECKPGYMLMPDGKNCKEVQRNRCKPKNPCQHKCNDNGKQIKCSCRRGYKLQSDGKSCKDIDECTSSPPVCLPNTDCHNTEGSYKCIPKKRLAATDAGTCPAGFFRNLKNNVCDDIDECSLPNAPCAKYKCENTIGGYKCGGVPFNPVHLPVKPIEAPPRQVVPAQEERCPQGFRAGFNEECEDVDECAIQTDDCNRQSQFCINTRGSFYCQEKVSKHCQPGFKINTENGVCEDIDECVDSHSLCRVDQECINVPGAYDCKAKSETQQKLPKHCPEGTRMRPGSMICEDIDECLERIDLCDQHQTCLNTYGSHECRCKIGFELDPVTGACTDTNECATHQHNCILESQRCENTVGSYLCFRLISCGTGYILHHSTSKCEDIDECVLNLHECARAGPDFHCVNIPGSFRCVLNRTTTSTTTPSSPLAEYEYEYYDSDEEIPDDVNQTKVKTINKTTQVVSTSTTTTSPRPIRKQVPVDVTPTLTLTSSTKPTEATNANYHNQRPEDQIPIKNQVPDIDLRVPEDPARSYYSTAAIGPSVQYPYTSPSTKFVDAEKEITTTPNHESEGPKIVIVNGPANVDTIEGVKERDGSVFVDTQDIPKNKWTNIVGAPEPESCQTGFGRNAGGDCVDIDECTTRDHICSGLTEVCRNTVGGYVCDCASGFRRDQVTGACDLIVTTPPTTASTTSIATTPIVLTSAQTPQRWSDWGYPQYRPPNYRPFRPRNMCDAGYHMNANTSQCEDINECTNGLATCADVEICVNTDGGYRCECPPKWRLDNYRHRCVPIRDSSKFPEGYGNIGPEYPPDETQDTKVVTIGTRHGSPGSKFLDPTFTKLEDRGAVLQCPWGYRLGDDNRCVDIDECALGTSTCGSAQVCLNLPGGYTCSCPSGHRLVGDNSCEDVDECALTSGRPICSQHADCVNTVGSYQCRCHEGFRTAPANDKVCVDVDECTEARQGTLCQHTCNNVWGGYRCSCHRGYRLNPDNTTCSDVDECMEFSSKGLCVGRCLNEPGSYRCTCPQGYRLSVDKRSCIDIDECETGEAPCASATTSAGVSRSCQNTRGGYKCNQITCPPGYKLENKHRCTKIGQTCPVTDWDCIHQPSTYSYNYITFVSKLYIPSTRVDLFTMRGPSWRNAKVKFQLRLVDVDAPPSVQDKADINAFLLSPSGNQAVVSLVRSLDGPQSIELELSMELFTSDQFGGIAVAKIIIYVSEYEF